jgi:hypothetical protein
VTAIAKTLFTDLAWSFRQPRYKDATWLARAVEQFHAKAVGVAPSWQPEAIALPLRHVRVRYDKHETTLRPRRPDGFTAAELLFGVHQFAWPILASEPAYFLDELELTAAPGIEPATYELQTRYWLALPADSPAGPLPTDVMREVRWSFTEPRIQDRAKFIEHALKHQHGAAWDADAIAIATRVILVGYGLPPDGRMQLVPLTSERPDGFSAGELLHRLHLACAPTLHRYDAHFFEGLGLRSEAKRTMPPFYSMLLGS